jgi:hypothetical protein
MSTVETTTAAERAAAGKLLPMIWGLHISRCVYAAAELGIADLLADGARSSEELAAATATHEPSLYRCCARSRPSASSKSTMPAGSV